jgi:molecular chaperone DnaK (HSP70)
MEPIAIGIDLGTTNSVIATVRPDGRPEVIPNAEDSALTPSVIWFGTQPPEVGVRGKEMQGLGESEIASFFKRNMGDPNFRLEFRGKSYTPTDLSALVLGKLRSDAEQRLGRRIEQAVISVPAYFSDAQRRATIAAGRQAGLEVLLIINEPTAAALAFRVQDTGREEAVLVYDLGGGTFDVSLVTVSPSELKVIGTAGDHNLGGKDWDDRIAIRLAERFAEAHGVDPLADGTCNDLLVRAEQAKKTLSARDSTQVAVQHDGCKATIELSRRDFEALTRDLMERTQGLCEQVLVEAGWSWGRLTGVLLVGGSTRMPMVHDYVRRMSGKAPLTGVNVDEAVALGAALTAAQQLAALPSAKAPVYGLTRRTTRDVMSHSLGVIAESPERDQYVNSIIVRRNQPIPCAAQRAYQLRTRRRGNNELEVYLTQGESADPLACSLLGKYRFTDIEHVEQGMAILDVAIAYDANGVVQVSALQQPAGRTLPMTVEPVPADLSWLTRPPAPLGKAETLTAYLAFDLSGSMSGTPLVEAQRAARAFVAGTDLTQNAVGLISFADQVRTDIEASHDAAALDRAIGSMRIGSVGYGNCASPFAHTHQLLAPVPLPRFLIVLTDGVWVNQRRAIQEAEACHADGIEVIAIGFGGADREFLRRVASSEEGAYFTRLGELTDTFSTIAQELAESSGSLGPTRRGTKGLASTDSSSPLPLRDRGRG